MIFHHAADDAGWGDLPVVIWATAAALILFIAAQVRLILVRRGNRPAAWAAEAELRRFREAIRVFAARHGGRLPTTVEQAAPDLVGVVTYRPTPRLDDDSRLLIAYNRSARHRVSAFPRDRAGRAVLFLNGRIRVVSEEAFEKLIEADDRLRERLGLTK